MQLHSVLTQPVGEQRRGVAALAERCQDRGVSRADLKVIVAVLGVDVEISVGIQRRVTCRKRVAVAHNRPNEWVAVRVFDQGIVDASRSGNFLVLPACRVLPRIRFGEPNANAARMLKVDKCIGAVVLQATGAIGIVEGEQAAPLDDSCQVTTCAGDGDGGSWGYGRRARTYWGLRRRCRRGRRRSGACRRRGLPRSGCGGTTRMKLVRFLARRSRGARPSCR